VSWQLAAKAAALALRTRVERAVRNNANVSGWGLARDGIDEGVASEASPSPKRLRARALATPLHVVLVEPEIPPNTGNIARLCAATASPLHLVGTLGFRIDEHSVRRAGVDYWHLVDVRTHPDFDAFLRAWSSDSPQGRLHLFSALAQVSYLSASYAPGDALVFGKESVGLPETLLHDHADRVLGIPTLGAVRSLNLANAVAIALYESLRQLGSLDETFTG
jgi:tRNA (cytidine/uridine-2'-O-)-methyltransferase